MTNALGRAEISTLKRLFLAACYMEFSTQVSGKDLHKNGDGAVFSNDALFFVKLQKCLWFMMRFG